MPPVSGPKEGLKSPQDQPLIHSVHLTLNLTECPSGVAGWQIAVASLLLSPRTPRGRHRLQCAGAWPGARWICWGSALCLQGKKKILGCLATSGQARKGREAVSHFWAGFLAVLTHCDLKQFLSLLSPPSIHPSRGAVTLSLATWLSSAVGESSLSWSLLVLGARLDGWCPSPAHQCNLCPCSE